MSRRATAARSTLRRDGRCAARGRLRSALPSRVPTWYGGGELSRGGLRVPHPKPGVNRPPAWIPMCRLEPARPPGHPQLRQRWTVQLRREQGLNGGRVSLIEKAGACRGEACTSAWDKADGETAIRCCQDCDMCRWCADGRLPRLDAGRRASLVAQHNAVLGLGFLQPALVRKHAGELVPDDQRVQQRSSELGSRARFGCSLGLRLPGHASAKG